MRIFITYISLFIAVFLAQTALAQAPCGTEITAEQMEAFYQRDKSHLEHKGAKAIVYIPVTYHLVSDDNGNGAFTMGELMDLHCSLVDDFADAEVHFYIHDIVYHQSSYYFYMQDAQAGNTMFQQENVDNTCNIFIVEEAKSGTTPVCGYSYLASYGNIINRNGIMLDIGCAQLGSTTLTHEMGHYLNLPHTFSGWEGSDYFTDPIPTNQWERVDGSNCNSRGDGFCDTPPDYISDRWNCFTSVTYTDAVGQSFVTDERNYMSYSTDACMEYFMPEQQAEVNAAPATYRPYLLTLPVPNLNPAGLTNLVFPADNTYGHDASNMFFMWDEVVDADYYLIQFTTTNFFNVEKEEVVSTNFLSVNDLFFNANYKWRVKAFTYANVCGDFTTEKSFSTYTNSIDVNVNDVLCAADVNGSAEVISGIAGVNYKWYLFDDTNSSFNLIASTTNSSVNNLSPGFYQVVITDNGGVSANTFFMVDNTADINITINESADILYANVAGGSPPYIYTWSNGLSEKNNNSPVVGINSLYITDANGCFQSADYNYVKEEDTVIVPEPTDTPVVVNYYPNPVVGDFLYFNFYSDVEYVFSLEMYSITGEKVINKQYDIFEGDNELEIDLQGLAKGVYFIAFPYDGELIVKKVFI